MTTEFRPELKNVTIANDKVKVVLVADKNRVTKILGDLALLEGQTITAVLRPESIMFKTKYHKDSDLPAVRYTQDKDGKWEKIIEEQTSMFDDEEFIDREWFVPIETVDQFIKEENVIEFPGKINPRDVIQMLDEGIEMSEIAMRNEMSEATLTMEIEKARQYFAPFAAAWDDKNNAEAK